MEEGNALAIASRIKQFIEYLGISITQFADATDIQRSSMSQILGGRNQKISVITIGKIHTTYPTLSIYWLLYGEGSMLLQSDEKEEKPESQSSVSSVPSSTWSLFDNENELNATNGSNDLKYSKENGSNSNQKQSNLADNVDTNSINDPFIAPHRIPSKNKEAVKIMIFYSDNTFETFSPDSSTK